MLKEFFVFCRWSLFAVKAYGRLLDEVPISFYTWITLVNMYYSRRSTFARIHYGARASRVKKKLQILYH